MRAKLFSERRATNSLMRETTRKIPKSGLEKADEIYW